MWSLHDYAINGIILAFSDTDSGVPDCENQRDSKMKEPHDEANLYTRKRLHCH